jgi:hypothetical protein
MIKRNQIITASVNDQLSDRTHPEYQIVHNGTGYDGYDGANYEHDDTGCAMNYSGCYDMMMSPISEHEGWTEYYDY